MLYTTIDSLIKYCRQLQKEYIEEDGERAGMQVLHEMVQNGSLSLSTYKDLCPAVENYKIEYNFQFHSPLIGD